MDKEKVKKEIKKKIDKGLYRDESIEDYINSICFFCPYMDCCTEVLTEKGKEKARVEGKRLQGCTVVR